MIYLIASLILVFVACSTGVLFAACRVSSMAGQGEGEG